MLSLGVKDILNVYKFGYCDFNFNIDDEKFKIIGSSEISFDEAKTTLINKVCSKLTFLKTPICILLSGGVDSNFLYLMLKKCYKETDIIPLTIVYQENDYNERINLRSGNKYNFQYIKAEIVKEVLDKINEDTYKTIFSSSSSIPTYAGLKHAKEFVGTNAVITGDGGDEIFCGYDKYLLYYYFRKFNLISSNRRNNKFKNFISNGYMSAISNSLDSIAANELQYFFRKVMDFNLPTLEKLMLFDRQTELIKLEIPKVETAIAMAGNVRVISPFLDSSIQDFVTSLPINYKYAYGQRKKILRSILKDNGIELPNKKKGFNVPINEWIGGESEWTSAVLKTLLDKGVIQIDSSI